MQLKEYSAISYCFLDRSFVFDPNTLIAQIAAKTRQAQQAEMMRAQRDQMCRTQMGAHGFGHNSPEHVGFRHNPGPDPIFAADAMGSREAQVAQAAQPTRGTWMDDPRNYESPLQREQREQRERDRRHHRSA